MATLAQEIASYEEKKKQAVPQEILATMAQTTEELEQTGIANKTIKQGDKAPGFTLTNHLNENRSLEEILKAGPVVLSFYRGGWCPYCNFELQALQQALPEIQAAGATLLAISPEQPDHSLTTAEKNDLAFEILFDKGNLVADSFGLEFELAQALKPIYEKFGIDVISHNGDDSFKLPLPATFVIEQDGTVSYSFVDADYTKRLEPADIIAHLNR